jgi:hypothetical protein
MREELTEMIDAEIFDAAVASMCETYNLTISHPYDDDYIAVYRDDEILGGMNPKGYGLGYNLFMFTGLLAKSGLMR